MDENQILSEISLRYRRNTIAICFVLTVLLAIPDIDISGLTVFGMGISDKSETAELWVWGIILLLFAYQSLMFCIWAIPDAISWTADKKEQRYAVWFEMTDNCLMKIFRNVKPWSLTTRKVRGREIQFIFIDEQNNNEVYNEVYGINVVKNIKTAFYRMIFVELGFPIMWIVSLFVFIAFFDNDLKAAFISY